MTRTRTLRALAALIGILLGPAAQALEFHGYFRDTVGFNSKGGSQACFGLPGSDFKARLANECDRYLEMGLSETGKVEKVDWRVEFMPASFLPSVDSSAANSVFVQQMWAGLKFNDWGGATVWAGRRYWKRHDVHSLDWFYWNPAQGNAAVGVEDLSLGGTAKLAVSLIRIDATRAPTAGGSNLTRGTYAVPDVRVYGIPVNPGGTLEAGVDLGIATDQNKALGTDRARLSPLLTVQHNQALWGGSNTLAFQYGAGAFAKESGDGPGQLLAGGTTSDKQWRVIEHLVVHPMPDVSGALVLVYQDKSASGGGGARIFTGEVRPAYHFTDWFKLQADLFYQTLSVKNAPAGAGTPALFKGTIAPTLVLGRDYYSRPELRLFVTYAAWNSAAAATGTIANAAFGTAKNGATFGAQLEMWF